MKTLLIITIFFFTTTAYAKSERYYQEKWCEEMGGQLEVVLEDGSRCDCLLPNFAVEVDFSKKWAEAIGQTLLYSALTNRCPGILLIADNPKRVKKYVKRIKKVCKRYNLSIPVWVIYKEVE